jgi:hypothetical protein
MEFIVLKIVVKNNPTDPTNCKPDFVQVYQKEPTMDYPWFVHGLSMDYPWIIYGVS